LTGTGCRENLGDTLRDPRLSLVEADITDRQAVAAILQKSRPRWVVNATDAPRGSDVDDVSPAFIHTNVTGTFKLLEAVREHFERLRPPEQARFRFLQVSTDEVYGSLGSHGRFTEQSPYLPRSVYAAAKAAGEHLARAYHATHGLPVIITNSSNNYGPRQAVDAFVPLSILNAVAGRSLPVYGEGENTSDSIYVDDHCEGLLAALEKGIPGGRYNFGGDAELRDSHLLDKICQLLEAEIPAARNPALVSRRVPSYAALKMMLRDRRQEERRCAVVSLKARKELGWKPRHHLDMGMAKTVRWYLDQREWYESRRAESLGAPGKA
jgi:dTDP-glucose 4,6-dehydratase